MPNICPRSYQSERETPVVLPRSCQNHCPVATGQDVAVAWYTAKRAARRIGLALSSIVQASQHNTLFASPYHAESIPRGRSERIEITPYPACGLLAYAQYRQARREKITCEKSEKLAKRAKRDSERKQRKAQQILRGLAYDDTPDRVTRALRQRNGDYPPGYFSRLADALHVSRQRIHQIRRKARL